MMAFSYVRYARAYDDLHRKSLYYMAKLDKLLQLEDAPDTKLDIESAGSEFYKEKSGKIRIMEDTSEHQAKRTKTAPDRRRSATPTQEQVEDQHTLRKNTVQSAAREEEEWLDDPIEPENGWLDDPVDPKPHSDTGSASADGIQLMDFRKHHEEEKR